MSALPSSPTIEIDVRTIGPAQRRATILSRFASLRKGQSLEVVDEHDLDAVHRLFDSLLPGQYKWQYLDTGPAQWRVRISPYAQDGMAAADDSCCSGGACSS